MPDRLDSRASCSDRPACFDEGSFLLADRGPEGALLLRRAFSEAGISNPVQVVPTGEEAIGYLRGDGIYSNRAEYPLPNVVLLDLNLHRRDGFEVLGWIRTQAALQSLVVILLTASNRGAEADRAHELGADYYLTKPDSFEALVELSRCLYTWLEAHPVHDSGRARKRCLEGRPMEVPAQQVASRDSRAGVAFASPVA